MYINCEFMETKQQGYRYENDWTDKDFEEYLKIVDIGITLPVNIEIEADHRVLNLVEAKKYFQNAKKIALRDCTCRTPRKHCNRTLESCFSLNSAAESNIKKGTSREITLKEALHYLEKAHEDGLVQMAYVLRREDNPNLEVNSICCCCSCCCVMLAMTQRFGLAPHILVSDTTSTTDLSRCISCGVCVDRCQFGAREVKNGVLVYSSERCMGCGLCVSKCPTSAISLIKKDSIKSSG